MNDDVKLDRDFKLSFMTDMAKRHGISAQIPPPFPWQPEEFQLLGGCTLDCEGQFPRVVCGA